MTITACYDGCAPGLLLGITGEGGGGQEDGRAWLVSRRWHSISVPPDWTRSSTMTTCRPLATPSFSRTMRLSPSRTFVQITCRRARPLLQGVWHLSWRAALGLMDESLSFVQVSRGPGPYIILCHVAGMMRGCDRLSNTCSRALQE